MLFSRSVTERNFLAPKLYFPWIDFTDSPFAGCPEDAGIILEKITDMIAASIKRIAAAIKIMPILLRNKVYPVETISIGPEPHNVGTLFINGGNGNVL